MRCCVQNCLNDNIKNTNKSLGITFHKIPRDPDQSVAWLKALAAAGCQITKSLVVCSEHFLPVDFDETLSNQRRVKHGVVPTLMTPLNQEEFKVCRVCLALDVKMYDLGEFKLSKMFQNITGISVIDKTDSTLHRVCWECAARLSAASAFRDKALLSDALLKDLVHINKREIEQLKQYYSQLKPTLTIQTVFTTDDIDCEDTMPENELYGDARRKSSLEEEGYNLHEPLIRIPVKTEIEPDPIAENIQIKDENNETFSELKNIDDSFAASKEDSDCEISNTEKQIDINENNDNIGINNAPVKAKIVFLEESAKKQPTFEIIENVFDMTSSKDAEMPIETNDDSDIVLAEDNVEENPTLDDTAESSSEEDTQSLAELASVKKVKKKTKSKVGASNKRPANRLNDAEKQKIIALKEKGMSMPEIAEETGKTLSCITTWWQRYSQEDSDMQEDSTVEKGTEQKLTEELSEFLLCPTIVDVCPASVRRKVLEAGLGKVDTEQTEKKESNHTGMPVRLRQEIIRLKKAGLSTSKVARLLGICRKSVRKWWNRWCNERDLSERKRAGRRRKTTAEEDQLILDRVAQSQSINTASLAKEFSISAQSIRRILKRAGYKPQYTESYVTLKLGRNKKVDEVLKERIMIMKQNGVGVTEMAREFEVPRTTIYQWWRRWCKEKNIETSNKDTNDNTEGGPSVTEDAKNENSEKRSKKLSRKRAIESNVEKTKKTHNKLSRKKAQANVEKKEKTVKKISRETAKRKKSRMEMNLNI